MYYHQRPSKVWRKTNKALQKKPFIPTIKFDKLSVMVWGGVSTFNYVITENYYIDILKKYIDHKLD